MKKTYAGLLLLLCMCHVAVGADSQVLLQGVAKKAVGAFVVVECHVKEETGSQVFRGVGVCIHKSGLFMATGIDTRLRPKTITKLQVILPGAEKTTFDAKLEGIDPLTGLTFLQVSANHSWSAIGFQRKANLSLGSQVVSVGLNLSDPARSPTLGLGYVASFRRVPSRLIRVTGGSLSPAGSVVFDSSGKAVGMVMAQPWQRFETLGRGGRSLNMPLKNEERPISFTPVEEFVYILANRPKGGKVRRFPWIGVGNFSPVPAELAEAKGLTVPAVKIEQVVQGRSADKAGLKDGDMIIGFNGKPLERLASSGLVNQNLVRTIMRASGEITLTILPAGGGASRTVKVKLEPMPELPAEAKRIFHPALGFMAREKVMLDKFLDKGSAAGVPGLLVLAVRRGTPSALAGLMQGDVIVMLNGRKVTTAAQVKDLLDKALSNKPPLDIVLIVRRGTGTEKVVIRSRK